jgi:hypothetical protein
VQAAAVLEVRLLQMAAAAVVLVRLPCLTLRMVFLAVQVELDRQVVRQLRQVSQVTTQVDLRHIDHGAAMV